MAETERSELMELEANITRAYKKPRRPGTKD